MKTSRKREMELRCKEILESIAYSRCSDNGYVIPHCSKEYVIPCNDSKGYVIPFESNEYVISHESNEYVLPRSKKRKQDRKSRFY